MPNRDDDLASAADIVPARAETFEPLVGETARFVGTDFALRLDRVERAGGPAPADMQRAPFTLIFSGSRGHAYLPEGLYRCDFGGSATFDIHVAPIHTAALDRQEYQAVFN